MKIIIIASDIHSGGGKVMPNDILSAAVKMKSINFYVLADSRYGDKVVTKFINSIMLDGKKSFNCI